ncbi:hypothetical protein [Erythrobacter litoralis]|uniref:hypothetical protein n=1 Tax=Erythrobacter litoralis TaxID=39960 RepID=UPI00243600EB|nr:hypothetical protein [Erythrobacter litoralis]
MIEAAERCAFEAVSVGERPEGLPIYVAPSSFSNAKLECFKRWTAAQKLLKVDWLR